MFHLFTYGALRDTQFLRGSRETAVPRGNFERLKIR
jgi:hypothetical protein